MDETHCFSFTPFSIMYVPTLRSISCNLQFEVISISFRRIIAYPITYTSTSCSVSSQFSIWLGGIRPFTLNVLTTTLAESVLVYLSYIRAPCQSLNCKLISPFAHHTVYKGVSTGDPASFLSVECHSQHYDITTFPPRPQNRSEIC